MEPAAERQRTNLAGIDILMAFLTVLVVAGAAYALIGGGIRKIRALTAERQSLRERFDYMTVLTDMLGKGEQLLSTLRAEILRLEQQFPAGVAVDDFYMALATAAGDHNVVISQMVPGQPARGEGYVELPISIAAVAPFEGLHRFLFTVGNLPRLTKWDALTITATENPPLCEAQMVVKIYSVERPAK